MKISDLRLNPNNPQIFNDLSKLENSIKEFPKMMKLRPLVYDPANMQMLGGNKRLICLQNLGYKEIPDEWIKSADELTADEKKRFILADNIGFGEWDLEVLEEEFSEYKISEWGLDVEFGDIDDIEEVEEFSESINFSIKCENLEELEKLQSKLNTSAQKISYDEFILKTGL